MVLLNKQTFSTTGFCGAAKNCLRVQKPRCIAQSANDGTRWNLWRHHSTSSLDTNEASSAGIWNHPTKAINEDTRPLTSYHEATNTASSRVIESLNIPAAHLYKAGYHTT